MYVDGSHIPLLSKIRHIVECLRAQSENGVVFINISDISKSTNFAYDTIRAALHFLEEKGIIVYIGEGICLLTDDVKIFDLKLFEKPITYRMVEKALSYLAENNPCSVKQFMQEVEMSTPSQVKIMEILEEGGIITRIRAGRIKYIFVKNKELFLRLCKFFEIEVKRVVTLDEFVKAPLGDKK